MLATQTFGFFYRQFEIFFIFLLVNVPYIVLIEENINRTKTGQPLTSINSNFDFQLYRLG